MNSSPPPTYSRGICILVPVAQQIPGQFLVSFACAFAAALKLGMYANFQIVDLAPVDRGRRVLLSRALATRPLPMYLLWLDADMFLIEEQISKLVGFMETHMDADAASALYFNKSTYEPVCWKEIDGQLRQFMPEGEAPQEVEAVGMGCMIIRTRALVEKLLSNTAENDLFNFATHSEDIHFCKLMKSAGMKLFVLPNIAPLHIGGMVGKQHYGKLR